MLVDFRPHIRILEHLFDDSAVCPCTDLCKTLGPRENGEGAEHFSSEVLSHFRSH